MRHRQKRKFFLPFLLILPTFTIIALFIYYPAFEAFYLSFFKVATFGNRKMFVGFQNYLSLFSDKVYLKAFNFTVIYSVVTVVVTTFGGYIVALLLNQKVPGVRIFRTLIFSPYAVSTAVAGALWSFILNPVVGHLNYILRSTFGIQAQWLTTIPYAGYSVIMASIWKMLPFSIIFYLAALQNVPDEMIEASDMDGASIMTKVWKIIFPMVSPITYYLIIMNIIQATFQSFAIIDVMTKGGPADYTTNLIYKVYMDGFRFRITGSASAQSVLLFLFMIIVTFIYFKFGRKQVFYQ